MTESVLLIESVENNSTGTGFVVHQDERGIYVVTCRHVCEELVRPMVNGIEPDEILMDQYIDLALFHIPKLKIPPLAFQTEACPNLAVTTIGFSYFLNASSGKRLLEATLGRNTIELHKHKENLSYEMYQLHANSGFSFARGNSGSPVICKQTGKVMAVVSFRNREQSQEGYAVDIQYLQQIWHDAPAQLFIKEKPKETVSSPQTPKLNQPQKEVGILKLITEGEEVSELQNKLNRLGYGLVVNGQFNRGTYSAVIDLQTMYGLTANGIVETDTMEQIDTLLTQSTQEPIESLTLGLKGYEVLELQNKLNQLGYGLMEDGSFGRGTYSAVTDFQNEHGLVGDGVVDMHTIQKINELVTTQSTDQEILKLGSKGDKVLELQNSLNQLGYGLVEDGLFGPGMYSAVVDLQKEHGLQRDGIVGMATTRKIKQLLN